MYGIYEEGTLTQQTVPNLRDKITAYIIGIAVARGCKSLGIGRGVGMEYALTSLSLDWVEHGWLLSFQPSLKCHTKSIFLVVWDPYISEIKLNVILKLLVRLINKFYIIYYPVFLLHPAWHLRAQDATTNSVPCMAWWKPHCNHQPSCWRGCGYYRSCFLSYTNKDM